MDNCTLTSNFNDDDAYAINIDAMCVSVDYDVADNIQYQIEQTNDDCDIEFE